MRFDLVDLQLFAAVVDGGSISAGAAARHLALASASARIAGMEARLGLALLDRGRRGVTPTAAGRALLHHARQIGAQVELMRGDLRRFASGLKGRIRLLSNTAGLLGPLPAALERFLAANPDVDIELEEQTSAEIVGRIAAGQADFGLIATSTPPEGLELRPLGPDRLVVVTAAAGPFADRTTVSFAELLDQPFVGLTTGALHDHLAIHASRLGRHFHYRIRLGDPTSITRLVAAGIGLAILPLAALRPEPPDGVVVVGLGDGWATRQLTLCARGFAGLSAHARTLAAEIEREFGR